MIKYLQKSGKSDFFLLIVYGKFISSRCLFGEGDILFVVSDVASYCEY